MMNDALPILLIVAVLVLLAFRAVDRWHQRWAWRNAEREAREYIMQRRRGVGVRLGPSQITERPPPPAPSRPRKETEMKT